jgi:fructose transport system substrate-binding protein
MQNQLRSVARVRSFRCSVAILAVGATLALAACSSSTKSTVASNGSTTAVPGGGSTASKVGVALILKNTTNPFFVSMQKSAETEAAKVGVKLTVSAGKADGDEQTQITAIENSISAGDKGILITPNGPGVNASIKKARDAGLFVIALDTPPDPANTVDITYATDNLAAGKLIGKWTASQLGGKAATIAMLDLFNDKIVSVDLNRDHGFLEGMGINPGDLTKNGGEAATGSYSGGSYTIVCHPPTQGAEDGGRTAMENCLSKNPNINVVYTINEPAANGAYKALQAAGKSSGVLIVSVDGGCNGVNLVSKGVIGATSQQYPGKMASLGVDGIADLVRKGTKPTTTAGLDFFNTGVALVTDKPVTGLDSVTSTQGATTCWGTIG